MNLKFIDLFAFRIFYSASFGDRKLADLSNIICPLDIGERGWPYRDVASESFLNSVSLDFYIKELFNPGTKFRVLNI